VLARTAFRSLPVLGVVLALLWARRENSPSVRFLSSLRTAGEAAPRPSDSPKPERSSPYSAEIAVLQPTAIAGTESVRLLLELRLEDGRFVAIERTWSPPMAATRPRRMRNEGKYRVEVEDSQGRALSSGRFDLGAPSCGGSSIPLSSIRLEIPLPPEAHRLLIYEGPRDSGRIVGCLSVSDKVSPGTER